MATPMTRDLPSTDASFGCGKGLLVLALLNHDGDWISSFVAYVKPRNVKEANMEVVMET